MCPTGYNYCMSCFLVAISFIPFGASHTERSDFASSLRCWSAEWRRWNTADMVRPGRISGSPSETNIENQAKLLGEGDGRRTVHGVAVELVIHARGTFCLYIDWWRSPLLFLRLALHMDVGLTPIKQARKSASDSVLSPRCDGHPDRRSHGTPRSLASTGDLFRLTARQRRGRQSLRFQAFGGRVLGLTTLPNSEFQGRESARNRPCLSRRLPRSLWSMFGASEKQDGRLFK